MRIIRNPLLKPAIAAVLGLTWASAMAPAAEWNPVLSHPVEIGPQASRLVVGFRATSGNAVTKAIRSRVKAQVVRITQAQTSVTDVSTLTQRAGVAVAGSRQLTPSMHVVFLQKTLYGADVDALLKQLRADPAVAFADVDERRYPHATPDDPLFIPAAGSSSGQWYMLTPSSATPTSDAAATDAASAWDITQGSSGTVIADVDNGIRFDHPDLGRAGLVSPSGAVGRLLPGYDFVSQDLNRSNSAPLGTFLIANDGDGWDPDPSDPGDWVSAADLKNTLFPPTQCGDPNNSNGPVNSSWHGTRVAGVLGAITNNNNGIAGMTWNPYILPVRGLGKCGGFDSDIIVGIQWAVGMSVIDDAGNPIPDNPYPADIINLSLGGTSSSCPSDYQSLVTTLTGMGVLVVASAGNESGPVDTPGNCPGVLAVAGLRNVGTKVGYSSLGPQVGIAAPAGNCVTTSGPCLRSIDTTSNDGSTVPGASTYTDQTHPNLGTSFSAPIVSGIAALMRAVNANLTPPQLIARIKASATPFPQPVGLAKCVAGSTSTAECACTTSTCGAGMVNALSAVKAALNPLAAVKIPAGFTAGSATFDASGSSAACGASVTSYAWSRTGGVTIVSGGAGSQVNIMSSGSGTLTLKVTDSAGNIDIAVVNFTANGATRVAPATAGTTASACAAPMIVTPAAPTISQEFTPASVAANAAAVLTLTLNNANGFALTQSGITVSLPDNLSLLTTPAAASTCSGANMSLTSGTSSVTLSGANIPAGGACDITLGVNSATPGTYTNTLAANVLMTGPAGGNAAPVSASLTVTAATSSSSSSGSGTGGGGGGGALDWLDIMLVAGILLVVRGHAARRPRQESLAPRRPRR
jgi:serine protease